ncbi:MAG TPA: Rap1a/Tai family immunity protein [Alphaproteobacteria bacterium]
MRIERAAPPTQAFRRDHVNRSTSAGVRRRRLDRTIFLVLAIGLFGTAAPAQVTPQATPMETGRSLLAKCRAALTGMEGGGGNVQDAVDAGICVGYLQSAADAGVAAGGAPRSGAAASGFCMPGGVGREELVRTVVRWLESDAGRLDENASDLVRAAYVDTFPCN